MPMSRARWKGRIVWVCETLEEWRENGWYWCLAVRDDSWRALLVGNSQDVYIGYLPVVEVEVVLGGFSD
jgi:hypothetical protein